MLRYDGRGFTRVEADYSKPWLPGESRPEATPGEDYSRPWFPVNSTFRQTIPTDDSDSRRPTDGKRGRACDKQE
ncbi:hypothetical protein BFJ71_g17798 [Fusarium oxysporum]|nr:hypothetical protein BFJ71_g17798 [Fusarium oxysporum]